MMALSAKDPWRAKVSQEILLIRVMQVRYRTNAHLPRSYR